MSDPSRLIKPGNDNGNGNGVAVVPVIAPPVMVRVTAPSSLEEGYTFDAVYNGEVFLVTVPRGGVKAGQIFEVPFLPTVEAVAVAIGEPLELSQQQQLQQQQLLQDRSLSFEEQQHQPSESTPMLQQPLATPPRLNRHHATTTPNRETPLGSWKTHWFDCLSEGCCHPSLCNAMCFPQILMGQVLTRMKLDCCGMPRGQAYKNTTRVWIFLTIFLIYQNFRWKDCLGEPSTIVWWSSLETIADELDDDDDDDDGIADVREFRHQIHDVDSNYPPNSSCTSEKADLLRTIHWVWFWTTTIVLTRLRRIVRRAHGISKGFPCEDFLCSVLCGCCTAAQLARQTANYKEQRAYCCTGTGMAEDGWFGHRQEELERRHLHGHHLVHANAHSSSEQQQQQHDRRRQHHHHHIV